MNIDRVCKLIRKTEDIPYGSFDEMNSVAASMHTYSDFIWNRALRNAKMVIMACCKLYGAEGRIVFIDGGSIVFPRNVMSIKHISYMNHLGEDCGGLDTTHMICSIADDLREKYNIPMDIFDYSYGTEKTFTDSELNRIMDRISKLN